MHEELIRQGMEEQDELADKYLILQIGTQVFGLPVRDVIEIVQMQPITAMPELPPYARGLINLRGRVIPVIDVNLRFGNPEQEYAERTCIVILELDGVQVGFIVDAVEEVLEIPPDQISQPPSLAGRVANYVTAIARLSERMVLLLDGKLLLRADLDTLGGFYQDAQ